MARMECLQNVNRMDTFRKAYAWMEDNIRMGLKEMGVNVRNWFIRLMEGIIGEPL